MFNASLALACLAASSAGAFSISSALTTPCHEPITMEALRNVRVIQPGAGPLVSSGRDDKAIIDDLPFKVAGDMRDLGAVSLVIGVRDNDLKGRDPNELDSLALIHGDPDNQREHCLRAPGDDGADGTQSALLACRAFIRERFTEALDGLNKDGRPSLDNRLTLQVGLSLRGKVALSLPRFYVHIGQALHAMQDSFTHSYRVEERTRVTASLNYVDIVDKNYLPERDGPRHSMELDRCDATDELRRRNRQLAVEASTVMLNAALEPTLTRNEKLVALEVVLDEYLAYQPGCSAANGWCKAPEEDIHGAGGCGYSDGAGGSSLLIASLALFGLRRGRRPSARLGGALLVLCLVLPFTAGAQTPAIPPPAPAAGAAVPVPPKVTAAEGAPAVESKEAATIGTTVAITPSEVKAVQDEAKVRDSFFAIYVAGAGSLYNAGAAAILGVRFRLSEYWQLGLDGEINGWYGIHARQLRWGATNVYASLTLRYPLKFEHINLRSTVQLGVAIEMVELAGVPAGSIGVFGGLNPLGVEFKLTGHLSLVFYPLGIALPVTQLKGAPFAFPQFRSTLGLEVSF